MSCKPPCKTQTVEDFKNSVVAKLQPVADSMRCLTAEFGLRPYIVRILRTRWSLGERGRGVPVITSILTLEPTPAVTGLGSLGEILRQVGLDEQGSVSLSGISGSYTEEELFGQDPPPNDDEELFWEIEFLASGKPIKRRFTLFGAPERRMGKLDWAVTLQRARRDRDEQGDLT